MKKIFGSTRENDEQQRLERFVLMTESPVRQLVIKMAWPTVVSMLVIALYNIIDAFLSGISPPRPRRVWECRLPT